MAQAAAALVAKKVVSAAPAAAPAAPAAAPAAPAAAPAAPAAAPAAPASPASKASAEPSASADTAAATTPDLGLTEVSEHHDFGDLGSDGDFDPSADLGADSDFGSDSGADLGATDSDASFGDLGSQDFADDNLAGDDLEHHELGGLSSLDDSEDMRDAALSATPGQDDDFSFGDLAAELEAATSGSALSPKPNDLDSDSLSDGLGDSLNDQNNGRASSAQEPRNHSAHKLSDEELRATDLSAPAHVPDTLSSDEQELHGGDLSSSSDFSDLASDLDMVVH